MAANTDHSTPHYAPLATSMETTQDDTSITVSVNMPCVRYQTVLLPLVRVQ